MSTFFGGPQLVSVVALERTTAGTSTYTIPAGHWAEVFAFGGPSTGLVNVASTMSISGITWSFANNEDQEFLNCITSGKTITIVVDAGIASPGRMFAQIKVFKNP